LLLLNTPHPSGKLARWGLALQELDLSIQYRPGKLNQLADSLFRCALTEVHCINSTADLSPGQPTSAMSKNQPQPQISSVKDREDVPAKDREDDPLGTEYIERTRGRYISLSVRQALDPELQMVMKYLQTGVASRRR